MYGILLFSSLVKDIIFAKDRNKKQPTNVSGVLKLDGIKKWQQIKYNRSPNIKIVFLVQ